ncbi:MAG TPA: L,D-transpeptidase [Aggregatilineales bacterium]|nr:L,D-transpeptidase [Aggregatilineales bacterium]
MKRTLLIGVLLVFDLSAVIIPARADGNPCPTESTPGCTFGLPTDQYNQLLVQMNAHPAPEVSDVPVDVPEVHSFSFYKVLPNTQVYDEPNGNVIDKLSDGFNFVIIHGLKSGYAMLRDGTWVKRSSLKQTYASQFSGVQFPSALPFPMAWVIQASIPYPFPGGVNNPKTPAVEKFKRVYLYASVHVGQWDWYLIGPGQWLEQRKLARVDPVSRPADVSGKWVAVNLYEQVLTAYDGDNLIFATLISSGLPGWETRTGEFKVWQKLNLTPMSGAMGQADEYSLPAVPYVMFFDNDISLHGTYWHEGFGFKHSHGCVNMSISDAHWVYNWMGDGDLHVVVQSGRS